MLVVGVWSGSGQRSSHVGITVTVSALPKVGVSNSDARAACHRSWRGTSSTKKKQHLCVAEEDVAAAMVQKAGTASQMKVKTGTNLSLVRVASSTQAERMETPSAAKASSAVEHHHVARCVWTRSSTLTVMA